MQLFMNVKRDVSRYVAYCDASFASETLSRSRYGYIYLFMGCMIVWTSVHTTRVLTSSTEAECHAVVHTAKENTWVREFVNQLNIFKHDKPQPTIIYQDNKSTISLLTKGGGNHKRSKHFTIEFDALREYVRENEIDVRYVDTANMPADMFTKMLPSHTFQKHRNTIMKSAEIERKGITHVCVGVSRRNKTDEA